MQWVRAEFRGKTRLGSNGIWERDLDGSWASGRRRISSALGKPGLNRVQIHHLLPLILSYRQQLLRERAFKIIHACDTPRMVLSTALVLPGVWEPLGAAALGSFPSGW